MNGNDFTNYLSTVQLNLLQKYGSSALSISEVAQELKVEPSDIEILLDNGELACKTICNKKRIMINSLLGYMFGQFSFQTYNDDAHSKHSVSGIVDILLEKKKNSCRKLSSYSWYCNTAKHIKNYFQDEYVENIDCKTLNRFFKEISYNSEGKQMSHKFIVAQRQFLENVIKYAFEEKYIAEDPFRDIQRIPYGKANNPKSKYLSHSQVASIIKALDNSPTYKPLITVLIHCGLRIGEALALRWSDIDEDNGIIHVEQALSLEYDEGENGELINKHYGIGFTKTVCSVRDVTADETVFRSLREWKVYVSSNKAMCERIRKNGNQNIIFVNRYGTLRSYQGLLKGFQRFLKDNGLGKMHVSFHMFRHTYATLLQEAGVDINVIRELMGHADVQTTANIYVNVNYEPKRRAADVLGERIENLAK